MKPGRKIVVGDHTKKPTRDISHKEQSVSGNLENNHEHPHLPAICTNVSSQHVRDIVSENEKLKIHLANAEQCIKNYRSMIRSANHSGTASTSVQTQTECSVMNPSLSLQQEIELKCSKLERANDRLSSKNNEFITELSYVKGKLVELEEEKSSKKLELMDKRHNQKNDSEKLNRSKLLFSSLSSELAKMKDDANQVRHMLLSLNILFSDVMQKLPKCILHHHAKIMEANLIQAVVPVQCNTVEYDGETNNKIWNIGHGMYEGFVDVATSPCKEICENIDFEIRREFDKELKQSNFSSAHDTSVHIPDIDIQKSTTAEACNQNKTNSYVEINVDTLTSKMNNFNASLEESISQLNRAHRNEVNAVKHLAHCKDLSRIASVRKITLDRDRALNELRHSK